MEIVPIIQRGGEGAGGERAEGGGEFQAERVEVSHHVMPRRTVTVTEEHVAWRRIGNLNADGLGLGLPKLQSESPTSIPERPSLTVTRKHRHGGRETPL